MSPGPLQRVLDAVHDGVVGRAGLSARTGLSPDLVDASLEQLERMGVLKREELGSGCPDGGCGSCGVRTTCAAPHSGRGPVLLTLTRRRS